MFASLKGLITPPVVISGVVVLAVAAVGIDYALTGQSPSGSYVAPTMGPLIQTVNTTGSVTAANTIDLGFQISGAIANAGPAVGTHVNTGATLGTLSSADLQASLAQAQAALQVQQANLSSLQAGATPQTVAVSQTSVTNAQSAIAQANASLVAAAQDAYAKSDSAIHTTVDQFFTNPRTSMPTLVFNMTDSQTQSTMLSGRVSMELLLSHWQASLAALPSDPSSVDTASLASMTLNNLGQVSSYLATVAQGLTEAIPTIQYPTSVISGWQTGIASARTSISGEISAMDAAQTAETSAQSGLASARSQLALTQAPPTQSSVEAQEAQVAAAQANVAAAQARLAQAVISAPISGTITVNNMEPGEIAAPGTPEISMISDTKFQFETYVSQADLAKIQVGDAAQVQLDAYQGQAPLSAHVIKIDPAATIQNGVSSYKVTLQFDTNDPHISAGGTGSAAITTQSLTNVMSVPTSAIITNGTDHFVIVKAGNGTQEVPVQIGISSDSGYTQITSGITSTDRIRSFGTN